MTPLKDILATIEAARRQRDDALGGIRAGGVEVVLRLSREAEALDQAADALRPAAIAPRGAA